MLTLYIIAGIFAYLAVAGFSYRKMEITHRLNCNRCSDEIGGYTGSYHDPDMGWFFSAAVWPAVIPLVIGFGLSAKGQGLSRDEKRRAKELAEANHKKELARIAMEEDAMLTHQLASVKNRGV